VTTTNAPLITNSAAQALGSPNRTNLDLNTPALGARADNERSAVSLRWLAACLLISLNGGALIGTALYGAIETQGIAIEQPERIVIRTVQSADDLHSLARKGDRLAQGPAPVAAKKEFSAPVVERAGDHEVIKTHSYVRLKTEFSLSKPPVADIPRLDLARLMLEGGAEDQQEDVPASYDPADAEATITKRSLAAVTMEDKAPALTDADVDNQIKELIRLAADAPELPIAFKPQHFLARTFESGDRADQWSKDDGTSMPFDSIDVRIIPENVVAIPKSQPNVASPLYVEREIVLEHGETLEYALRKTGAPQAWTDKILVALSPRARSGLSEGQHIRLLLGPENLGRPIEKVTLDREDRVLESVAVNDRGQFVSVVRADLPSERVSASVRNDDVPARATLYESVYATCLENNIPPSVIDRMIRALAYSVDFNQPVATGDGLSMFFSNDEGRDPELLYAAVKMGDEIRKVYRYQSPDTGNVTYLDEEGRSARKLLMRKPVAEGRLSSPFGGRVHPILGYTRPHNGVDWAAPRGTPIVATGDGVVEEAGATSGYGNHIVIKHVNGYTTGYGHLARIARGLAPGTRVKLGQVIGYVGSTGLSTGPHIHYEVKINDRFVDPMKVRLPDAPGLTGEALTSFRQDGKQVDELRHQV